MHMIAKFRQILNVDASLCRDMAGQPAPSPPLSPRETGDDLLAIEGISVRSTHIRRFALGSVSTLNNANLLY